MPKYLLQASGEDQFGKKVYVVELELLSNLPGEVRMMKNKYGMSLPPALEPIPVWSIFVGKKKFYILRLRCPKKIIEWGRIKENGRDFKAAVIEYIQTTHHPSEFDYRRQGYYETKTIEKVDPMTE